MYARLISCSLQTEKRLEFNDILRDQVLPVLKNEPGFVDLVGMVSEEQPDHALGIAYWKTKEDADRVYHSKEPMLDLLKPLLTDAPAVEHYNVTSSMFPQAAVGKAA
ncbi:MAG TPA: antibiotic biosynthesis monooxygenase [Terriglobales bacterium]|jgi:quinol monooxygenase YgiN|nr:antibiotic biosynthesis monooxygenase [Terriglobales bacterium]